MSVGMSPCEERKGGEGGWSMDEGRRMWVEYGGDDEGETEGGWVGR